MDELIRARHEFHVINKSIKGKGLVYTAKELGVIPEHKLKRACSGWVATYEIWNLRGDHYPICHFDIPLDDSEVLLQARYISKEPDSSPFRFTTAISTNIRMFAILRTVYLLKDIDSSGQLHYTSAVLPVSIKPAYPLPQWRQTVHPGEHCHRGNDLAPHYEIKFSSEGQYVCFHDCTELVLLEVLQNEERCAISLLSCRVNPIFREIYCLHRNLPLLAFQGKSSIKLWDFKCGKQHLPSPNAIILLTKGS
jgi:hypothetical protein